MREKIEPALPVNLWGIDFDYGTIFISVLCSVALILLSWLVTRRLKLVPSKAQLVLEGIVGAFDSMAREAFGKARGRRFLPLIGSLFLFILSANIIGVVPIPQVEIGGESYEDLNGNGHFDGGETFVDSDRDHKRDGGFVLPAWEEPTRNLNVPVGLALFFLLVAHVSAIRVRGVWGYLKSYGEPLFFMAPLNLVSKLAGAVSVSFRLFGNIFGGAVIMVVVSQLLASVGIPVVLAGFFGLFVGVIQAFVFAILNMTYIALEIHETD